MDTTWCRRDWLYRLVAIDPHKPKPVFAQPVAAKSEPGSHEGCRKQLEEAFEATIDWCIRTRTENPALWKAATCESKLTDRSDPKYAAYREQIVETDMAACMEAPRIK